jgi:hypothetical protein
MARANPLASAFDHFVPTPNLAPGGGKHFFNFPRLNDRTMIALFST